MAGSPCTDHSLIGQGAALDGLTCIFFLIWVALRLVLQEAVIIHENVINFPIQHLKEFLPMYHIDASNENSCWYGWPVRRMRMYAICRHKLKVSMWRCPLNMFTKLFYRHSELTFRAFFIAEWRECLQELWH